MRTGRLSISRGHQLSAERPAAPAKRASKATPVSFTPSKDQGALHLVQVRLNALERLTRLVEQGALSVEEFRIEKSLVLRLTGEELLLTRAAPRSKTAEAPGPSLLGRLFGWRGLLFLGAAGLATCFAVEPAGLAQAFDGALALFGG